jgi:predicted transcriptional regulator
LVSATRRVGRPPIAAEAASEVVRIRLTPSAKRAIDALARLNQMTRTAFIRDAIEAAAAECSEQQVFSGEVTSE